MDNTLVTLVLAVVIFVLLCGSREGFVDFGFSGYQKPVTDFRVKEGDARDLSQYKKDLTKVSPKEISEIISVIQESVKRDTGKCIQPLQTIYINRFTGPTGTLFDARVMFYDSKHMFVTEITGQLVKNSDDTFTILSIQTQEDINKNNGFAGDGTGSSFLPEETLSAAIAPTKGLLDKVVKEYEPPAYEPAPYGD